MKINIFLSFISIALACLSGYLAFNIAEGNENDKIYDLIYSGDIEGFNSYIADKFGPDRLGELYNGGNNNMSLSVIYYPDINEFRGNVSVQMVMKYYQ